MNIQIVVFCFVMIGSIWAQVVPRTFFVREEGEEDTEGLQSNVVVEIIAQGEKTIWLGTGDGLSFIEVSSGEEEEPEPYTIANEKLFVNDPLPDNGISAIGVIGDKTILVARAAKKGKETAGGGLALSTDSDNLSSATWKYFEQPTDDADEVSVNWGGVTLKALPVTVKQNNVTYDISIGKDYYWIASWAGGLRRIKKENLKGSEAKWERVPLPLDTQNDFICGDPDSSYVLDDEGNIGNPGFPDYELNPRDPPLGNHNHKAFSVITYEDTVWVGTANGINRGIMDASYDPDTEKWEADSECVDWKHYSFPTSSMSGNWVIAIEKQEWEGRRTIWAVTRAADQAGEQNGISYTKNDGETWQTVSLLKGEYGYNIFSIDGLVYIATRSGLWRTQDGQSFALYRPAMDEKNDQIIDNDVYAVLHDTRESNVEDEALWIGTGDGLARTYTPNSNTSNWKIYRSNVSSITAYAYPNPFSPTFHNRMDGDGYVRFKSPGWRGTNLTLTILNFAMEEVRTINYTNNEGKGALKWDGRDESGTLVANGIYFCNLYYDNAPHWVKLVVVK